MSRGFTERTHPIEPTETGRLLLRLRERAGLSQNLLALLAGCSASYISQLESRPNKRISRERLLGIAKALEADRDDTERLLVAAGYCPETILAAGGWDGVRERLAGVPVGATSGYGRQREEQHG